MHDSTDEILWLLGSLSDRRGPLLETATILSLLGELGRPLPVVEVLVSGIPGAVAADAAWIPTLDSARLMLDIGWERRPETEEARAVGKIDATESPGPSRAEKPVASRGASALDVPVRAFLAGVEWDPAAPLRVAVQQAAVSADVAEPVAATVQSIAPAGREGLATESLPLQPTVSRGPSLALSVRSFLVEVPWDEMRDGVAQLSVRTAVRPETVTEAPAASPAVDIGVPSDAEPVRAREASPSVQLDWSVSRFVSGVPWSPPQGASSVSAE